ncbi:MAG: hypothetical protein J6C31_04190 [Prevotella sp.]|nr:hypothetical protein [Prevotella sp.]
MTDKDIKILLERFMAGLTSVEEEQTLAGYFRTHDVCDEWKAYKEMFAWFDRGMPEKTEKPQHKARQWRKIAAMVTAAAAAAIIIICMLPETAHDITIKQGTAYINDTYTKPVFYTDSTKKDTVKTTGPVNEQSRNIIKKHKYSPAPPKIYYAMNSSDSLYRHADIRAEKEVQKIYARQEELIQAIYMQSENQERDIRQMLATMDYEADYATEEDIY